jgi:uncharacterized protein YheU (UPF0270 family)
MIKIDYRLLSEEALDNLLIDIITREGTDYGPIEYHILEKKVQLQQKLFRQEATIVYDDNANFFDIISVK